MLKAINLALLAPFALANDWRQFGEFKARFEMMFESQEEELKRFDIFKQNLKKAKELNKLANGEARFGVTKFAHLTAEEFKTMHKGYNSSRGPEDVAEDLNPERMENLRPQTLKNTPSVDWRHTGATTPVKDQGQCGSCWAFSATQAVETGYWLSTQKPAPILAPQQSVDCDPWWRLDFACSGGMPTRAYGYMRRAGGVELEKDYPYISGHSEKREKCQSQTSKFVAKVGKTKTISGVSSDEGLMLNYIKTSPMSVCVDAESWQLYLGGVVDRKTCGVATDHCVHLVGYQSEENAWIVKNSWAGNWGEEGYIRVRAGENACNIASAATVVEVGVETTVREEELEIAV